LKRTKDALIGPREPAPQLEPPPEPEPSAALPEWEYVPEGWARQAGGWDVEAIARAYRELEEYTETRRGIGLVVKEGVRDLLLKREQRRFLREDWPSLRNRIKALELDPAELLKGVRDR